jgi:2,4-dienoyl-CoA reductase-like NADH-dependent reductase (Old Yellow Enzyme family)
MRSPKELINTQPLCPSDDSSTDARGLSLGEVIELRDDFIAAAVRAKKSGYQGVEIHGAHGYILSQFLSSEINRRQDEYGGTNENRSRIIFEIVEGIRNKCGEDFILGVRLSPEGFGLKLGEIKEVCEELITLNNIDFLDMSLWDSFKEPNEEEYKEKNLLQHFTEMKFGNTMLTVAGNIRSGKTVMKILERGVDFVTVGRAGILHHDFPKRVIADKKFEPIELPVSKAYLTQEGLSETFIKYMQRWQGFVKE